MNAPLDGVRVIDISTYAAGPSCGRILADMGAEVIKVEGPNKDPWRVSYEASAYSAEGYAPGFDLFNTGKKCICLNLKTEKGLEALHRLLKDADVLLSNVRSRSMMKLGLDPETLREKYPGLIYATIDGFGPEGPDADLPGFDNISFWGRSGFAREAVIAEDGCYYPLPVISAVGDTVTGGFAAAGILSALYAKAKTGLGQTVNLSLYSVGIWANGSMLLRADPKAGNEVFPKRPEEIGALDCQFCCGDGEWVVLGQRGYDKDANHMYELLGVRDQVEAYGGGSAQRYNNDLEFRKFLYRIMSKAMLKKPAAEWLRIFRENDIPMGPVAHYADVLRDEQAIANKFVDTLNGPDGHSCTIARPPIHMSSLEYKQSCPAQKFAESTDEVLLSVGYTQDELDSMRSENAIK